MIAFVRFLSSPHHLDFGGPWSRSRSSTMSRTQLDRKRLEREEKDKSIPLAGDKKSASTTNVPNRAPSAPRHPNGLKRPLGTTRRAAAPPPRSFDPLDLLPVELILRILDLLPFASLVLCSGLTKSWRAFVRRHRDLWRDLALVERRPGTLNNAAIKMLASRAGSQLRSLHICLMRGGAGAANRAGGVTLAGLRDLGIAAARHTQFSALTIQAMSKFNRDTLVALLVPSLTSVSVPRTAIDDEAVAAVLTRCPRLQRLDISDCTLVTGTGFSHSAPSGNASPTGGLVTLNISGCSGFSPQGIETLTRHPRITSTLTHLMASSIPNLNNWCLLYLSDLSALHTLEISHHPSFTPARIVQVLSTLRNLRSLTLPYCPAINDQVLQTLAHHSGPSLESLSVSGSANISGLVWTQCVSQFTRLMALTVSKCPGISTSVLAALPPTLTALDVAGIDAITDRGLDALVLAAPALHTLHVGHTRVTTAGLKRVVALLPHLHQLDVSGCAHVSPAGLAELRGLGQRKGDGVVVVYVAQQVHGSAGRKAGRVSGF